MKILSVVTLVTPRGEYGGPVRVAVNQLVALRERGHEVVLTGAQRGFSGRVPHEIDSIPARLFPVRSLVPGTGFAGLSAPGLWFHLLRNVTDFDVVHVHTARDLVTLPAARIAQSRKVPTILQTHGMIDESEHPLARPLDAVLTRPALKRARCVTYLTPLERASLEVVARGRVRLAELANGVPLAEPAPSVSGRPPHVLYLARLAPRKRPSLFVEVAARLAADFPTAQFTLVGPDEGEGSAVERAIGASGNRDRIRWIGPASPGETLDLMRAATIYVLPSVDEPYPMAVLEAMSVGLPVLVTDTCGLAPLITEHDAGVVVDDSREALEAALRALLDDPAAASEKGSRGRDVVRAKQSMAAVAARLEQIYAQESVRGTRSESR